MGRKLALIYGGQSGEHEVSVLSAASVMAALDRSKFEVLPIGITRDGQWIPGLSPQSLVQSKDLQVKPIGEQEAEIDYGIVSNPAGVLLGRLKAEVDLVFPLLHGPMGEDGSIQGLLELAGIPYIGGGILASAVGMDKALMKKVFQMEGLPVGDYLVYLRWEWREAPREIVAEIEEKLGYPCFVKPANMGSSVGISKARCREELQSAMEKAAMYDRKLVIEAFLEGREIECSVLGNDRPKASLPGEIVSSADFYDYEAKYLLNQSKLLIPAPLSPEKTKEIQDLAIKAFKAIDCSGLARVDFFVLNRDERVVVNEINTMPGFTQISMFAKMWEATGISYQRLLEELVDLALERYAEKKEIKKTWN
ncbi:MAG TPA: D-alanine--D-alanine ligase [Bacillota bacterium]